MSVLQVSAGRAGAACSEAADYWHTAPACCGGAGASRRDLGTKNRPVDKDLYAGYVYICLYAWRSRQPLPILRCCCPWSAGEEDEHPK